MSEPVWQPALLEQEPEDFGEWTLSLPVEPPTVEKDKPAATPRASGRVRVRGAA